MTNSEHRTVKDTRGQHLIIDSATDREYHTSDGLAFALGVACIEAEIAKSPTRLFQVCHPNYVPIYHVLYTVEGHVCITSVGSK